MKYIAKPSVPVIKAQDVVVIEDPPVSDISVDRLIDNGLVALHREMRNLLLLSAKGKLDAASSRDLRDTIKLLFELKERESQSLRGLTDEELTAKAKAIINGDT